MQGRMGVSDGICWFFALADRCFAGYVCGEPVATESDVPSPLKQCEAIILQGRSPSGGRAGLAPPRRCRKLALGSGEYCEVHQPQAALQSLLRECLRPRWEHTVERWQRQQARRNQQQRKPYAFPQSS